jgi:hypothetical protein
MLKCIEPADILGEMPLGDSASQAVKKNGIMFRLIMTDQAPMANIP